MALATPDWRLRRTVIFINLTEDDDYHKVYHLRDERNRVFSELLEVHVLELSKKLTGNAMDEWICFFNAETEEELDMIRSRNPGIIEAIREVKDMSIIGSMRALHEQRLKFKRDLRAREAYVREEGIAEGITEGEERMLLLTGKMLENGEGSLLAKLSDKGFLEEMYRKYQI